MPNNCSTLIQRKQHILHKILRSNSDGKLQNAVAETTAELRVAGTRKVAGYSSPANHLIPGSTGSTNTRRINRFHTNRVQPTAEHVCETHFPFIRDTSGSIERQQQLYDDLQSSSRAKTPVVGTTPKNTTRPPSASMSSLYNNLAKRSMDNFMNSYGDMEESNIPLSRQSRRPSNESNRHEISANQAPTKQTLTPNKRSQDGGLNARYLTNPHDSTQQPRAPTISIRVRPTIPNGHVESPRALETTPTTKERTTNGQLYQRRTNNNSKAPTKQKIDKYRRRSEEVTQAMNGNTSTNPVRSSAIPSPKPPPPTPTHIRRVTSDAEIQARLEILRLSLDPPTTQPDSQQNSRSRLKSPYLYTTHQQLASASTPHMTSTTRRIQPISSFNQAPPRQTSGAANRRQQPPNSTAQGNLYLAFIASRHLSTLEDNLLECDIDHPKLLRIFTWLKNVEKHRPEQSDHEKLLIVQNQRVLNQEDNLSLYSEIQYAVDDVPPNTSGKPGAKIATMQFED